MALSNFKKIKRLFVVDEETTQSETSVSNSKKEENDKENKENSSESKISWKSSASSTADGTINSGTSGQFNQAIFDSLTKAIADANLPGEDYLEFVQGLQAMKDVPMEESLKLKSVFITLTTKGLTVQKIIESADHYLKILEQEKIKFYSAIDSQKKAKIEAKQKLITDIENKNIEKAALIKKLTDEIAANNSAIEKEKAEIVEAQTKINSTENDFVFTIKKMTNQINDNISKIKEIK
jgi:hypothetical protein